MTPATSMGLSIGLATGLYAVSFGALSVASGFTPVQTSALSLLLFAGGSQFAFVGVIAGGGAGATALGAAGLLGIRNALYGLQLNVMLRPRGMRRLWAAHITVDESFATASGQQEPEEQRQGFWVAGIATFVFWNGFTLVGSMLGQIAGDTRRWGLDGAAGAAFLALLWPRLRSRQAGAVAVCCAGATTMALPMLPAGLPIVLAAVIAVVMSLSSNHAGEHRGPDPISGGEPREQDAGGPP